MAELTRSIRPEASLGESDHLLVRLKEGEDAAFGEVFQLYRDMVYNLASRLLVDKGDSLDVTQDVFLTLFRKVHSFRGDSSIKTWLYRVTVNQAAHRNRWWKRRSRDRTISLSISESVDRSELQLPSRSPSPARSSHSSELRAALQRALENLPFEQRVAVILRDVEGLTYEEIGEITGSQAGTVKSRIARGRSQLRDRLLAFQGGEAL